MTFSLRTNNGRKLHPAVPELANQFLRGEIGRRDFLESVEKILQDNAVMVQPFWSDRFGAASNKVRGFRLHPSTYSNLFKTWLA